MTVDDDRILARELGKVAELAGRFSDTVSDLPGAQESISWGAGVAARYLPTERAAVTLHLDSEPAKLLTEIRDYLREHGQVSEDEALSESPFPQLTGIVGSGMFNLNPAVLHAELVAVNDNRCTVNLWAAAKEGLIKQRTAEKAVQRLASKLARG